jgi:GrpB-like predicted nucleotidyltransferase (UPF0157 family)
MAGNEADVSRTFRWGARPFLIYIHVLHEASDEVRRFRDFRDRLKRDSQLVVEYCAVKRAALAEGRVDTDDYAVRKRPVIHKTLGDAQALRNITVVSTVEPDPSPKPNAPSQ